MFCCGGGKGEREKLLADGTLESDGGILGIGKQRRYFDVVLVAPLLDPESQGEEEVREIQTKRLEVIRALRAANLDVRKFTEKKETDDDTSPRAQYFLIGASEDLLKHSAGSFGLEKKVAEKYKPKGLRDTTSYYEEYSYGKDDRFERDVEGSGGFFTSLERIRAVFHIIEGPDYEDPGCAMQDLDKLVADGVFKSYFTLVDHVRLEALKESWIYASPLTAPPIDMIRDYLGEKIALYFAWMNLYTGYLGLLALAAIIPTVYGWFTDQDRFYDNSLVPLYGVGAIIWAQLFIEHWKRKQASYAFMWNTEDFEDEEVLRPEFRRYVRSLKQNWESKYGSDGDGGCTDPKVADFVQGAWTRAGFINVPEDDEELKKVVPAVEYFSERAVRFRFFVSSLVTLLLVGVIVFVSLLILGLRAWIQKYYKPGYEGYPEDAFDFSAYAPAIAGTLNAIFIRIMSLLWAYLGLWLNDYEMHRTDTQWEDAYIWKTFAFQFINSYITTIYIGFVQPLEVPSPLINDREGQPLIDHCVLKQDGSGTDCMEAIAVQTASLVIVGQFSRYLSAAIPAAMLAFKKWRNPPPEQATVTSQVTAQAHRATFGGTYQEYLEMVIQFGFVAMFAVAFPLGAVVCYFTNILEKRSDAAKVALLSRRPKYLGAQDIGSVLGLLELVATLSVLTNGLILYLSCEAYWAYFPASWSDSSGNKFWILVCTIVLEHLVLSGKTFISLSVADTPQWVLEEKARAAMRVDVNKTNSSEKEKRMKDYEKRREAVALNMDQDDVVDDDMEF